MGLIKDTAHDYYSGNDLGSYQFTSLGHIINNFMIGYVGEDKIISKIKRTDIAFHAQRCLQEFSYDTLKSIKSQEITLPPSLVMPLPQDYVNYVKLTWSDDVGIEHVIYPASKTSNPSKIAQDSEGNYIFSVNELGYSEDLIQSPFSVRVTSLTGGQSSFDYLIHEQGFDIAAANVASQQFTPDTNPLEVGMVIDSVHFPVGTTITSVSLAAAPSVVHSFTTSNPSNLLAATLTDVLISTTSSSETFEKFSSVSTQTSVDNTLLSGERYGLDPQHAQTNGTFYIDEINGKIHFSSNMSGRTLILKYISDGLGTESEMVVHKFAEEAMYKCMACAVLSTSIVGQPLVPRFKKEKFAETRKAKLRLSNIKIEELTQVLRGKSKQIKH